MELKNVFLRMDAVLIAQPAVVKVLNGVTFLALLGWLDYSTGTELYFSLFYLVPLALATWYGGAAMGMAFAVASGVMWYVVNYLSVEVSHSYFVSIWNATSRLLFFVIVSWLLAELKRTMEKERALARTDYVTGAFTSRAFYELAEWELDRSQRHQWPFTVVCLDLDNFKTINDSYGHKTGDALLQIVAKTLSATLRKSDIIARLGGDEFALLLPETDFDTARVTVTKIQEAFAQAMRAQGWPVTMSIGVLTCINAPLSVDEMITLGDRLLYDAKKEGRNRFKQAVYGTA